jgi:IS605 OrfB family transposase
MKQLIGNHRFLYNLGVKYLYSLERGFYIPRKGSVKKPDYILYEGDFFKVETGGIYTFGILPIYDSNGKQLSKTNFHAIRSYLKSVLPDWFKNGNFPAHTVDQAAREVAFNYSKIMELRKKDKKKFRMNFKSKRKSVTETILMEGSSLNKKGIIYSSKYKNYDSKVYTKETLNLDVDKKREYTISYNRNNYNFNISLPVKIKTTKENKNKKEWCSIDPGEKTFATIYDPWDKKVFMVANSTRNEFENDTVSKLQRSISRNPHRKKNLKRALQNAFEKDKNKRKELHHKLANYLCSNFKHIIIPSYGIKTMKLHSTVNKSMRNLGFYQFLTFLKHKCNERNVKIHIVEEHYTSQACCNCGCLNKPNDRDYKCNSCDMEMHRDVNGAVNIGLKHVDKRQ